MFGFLKNKLAKIYESVTSKISGIFSKNNIDEDTLSELQDILIKSDLGAATSKNIIKKLRESKISNGQELQTELQKILLNILQAKVYQENTQVYLMVGINGSGKTTFVSKLANRFVKQNKKVLLVAADTFRAAATEQLEKWAQNLKIDIVTGKQGQDPAAVVFAGCQKYKAENYDILIIDTAGRLQTKVNLMKELEKIKNVISKNLPDKKTSTLLTVDSMLGQNSFEQAKIFHESTNLDGIVLTKLDGTGKGGIVFAITQEIGIPVAYISFGEAVDQIALFEPEKYVQELF
jgi:fused signal recognition particle receptor